MYIYIYATYDHRSCHSRPWAFHWTWCSAAWAAACGAWPLKLWSCATWARDVWCLAVPFGSSLEPDFKHLNYFELFDSLYGSL